jgi:hypothetical protein
MKFANDRPFADPEKAARRIMEIASTVEPAQDGRIFVELINGTFLFKDKGSPAEYGAGMKRLSSVDGSSCMKVAPSCALRQSKPSCLPDFF